MAKILRLIILFVILELSSPAIQNETAPHPVNAVPVNTRRNNDKSNQRSTSSSSGEKRSSTEESGNTGSLDMTDVTSSSSESTNDKSYIPKSSKERWGWRKWHRKCTPCPNDAKKKWRDPTINWICGQYQRARRSFKSKCMMHYRNCQDGTMFTQISGRRCNNDTKEMGITRGDHFFYDYKVVIRDDSSVSEDTSDSPEEEDSSSD